MHDDIDIPAGGRIEPTAFSDALSERYLAYALSTITSRSLPDVRDGLKAGSPPPAICHASAKT